MTRLRDVQARFPNMTVDLTFLESKEYVQVCRGGLSFTGFEDPMLVLSSELETVPPLTVRRSL